MYPIRNQEIPRFTLFSYELFYLSENKSSYFVGLPQNKVIFADIYVKSYLILTLSTNPFILTFKSSSEVARLPFKTIFSNRIFPILRFLSYPSISEGLTYLAVQEILRNTMFFIPRPGPVLYF